MEFLKYCIPLAVVVVGFSIFKLVRSLLDKRERNDSESETASAAEQIPAGRSGAGSIEPIGKQLKAAVSKGRQGVADSDVPSEIGKLIDLAQLQKIQDNISRALGIACITVNTKGEPVTRESGFTDFCIKYTRGTAEGLKRCYACDAGGGTLSAKTNKPAVYSCHSGLVDFGVPILIGDAQIGSILGGQVLTAAPDEALFREIARQIGADEELYIQALRKVPIVSPDKVQAAANLLYLIANTLSELGHNRWKAHEYATNLSSKSTALVENTISSTRRIVEQINSLKDTVVRQSSIVEEFSSTVEEMIATLGSIAKVSHAKNESSQQLLEMSSRGEESIRATKKGILDIVENSKQIESFMRIIGDINERTNLLAINASIEAAHAGDRGGGFSIVAGEIRKLSERSAQNAVSVEKFLKNSSEQAEGLTSTATNTESSYMAIKNEIKEVLSSLESITRSTGEMHSGSNEILSGVGDLQSISSAVSDSTSQIEQMISIINESIMEMREISDAVSNMAQVLDN